MTLTALLALHVSMSGLAPVDDLYLRTAAEDSIAELKLVDMAVQRTHNPQVKKACEMMIREHTKQLAEIRSLGARFQVDLPDEPNDLHKALFESLSKKHGKEFDKSFSGDHCRIISTM